MPNIPPTVAYFPQVNTPNVPTSRSIFATLQGEDSPGADLTSVTASGGISASPSTGSVVLANLGIRKIVGAGGIGAPYNEAQDETQISCPAINNVAAALRTFVPLAFGTAGNTTAFVDQGTDVNLYTIVMPVASTYLRLTLFFQAGTTSEDPFFYGQGTGSGTINEFIIYLSYTASTGTPPTNIPIYLSPNSYVFNTVANAALAPDGVTLTGGTFMPNITLEMTCPDPVNTWFVNMAHLGSLDPNVRVVWDFRAIAPSISTARAENVVDESVVTPD
jgi:hypothetical protein